MDDKICRNCRFFEEDDGKYPPYGIKYRDPIGFKYGSCLGPAEDNFDCRDMKSDQIAVHCGHDGGILMGEKFGCIHFKKKRVNPK